MEANWPRPAMMMVARWRPVLDPAIANAAAVVRRVIVFERPADVALSVKAPAATCIPWPEINPMPAALIEMEPADAGSRRPTGKPDADPVSR